MHDETSSQTHLLHKPRGSLSMLENSETDVSSVEIPFRNARMKYYQAGVSSPKNARKKRCSSNSDTSKSPRSIASSSTESFNEYRMPNSPKNGSLSGVSESNDGVRDTKIVKSSDTAASPMNSKIRVSSKISSYRRVENSVILRHSGIVLSFDSTNGDTVAQASQKSDISPGKNIYRYNSLETKDTLELENSIGVNKLTEEISSLREMNKRMSETIEAYERINEEQKQDFQSKIEAVQKAVSLQANAFAELKSSSFDDEASTVVSHLTTSLHASPSDRHEAESERIKELISENREKTIRIQKIHNEKMELEKKLEMISEENAIISSRLTKLSSQMKEAKRTKQKLQEENKSLRDKLTSGTSEINKNHSSDSKYISNENETEELRIKNSALVKTIETLKSQATKDKDENKIEKKELVEKISKIISSLDSLSSMQYEMMEACNKREDEAREQAAEERETFMSIIYKQEQEYEKALIKREQLIKLMMEEERELKSALMNGCRQALDDAARNERFRTDTEAKHDDIYVAMRNIQEEIKITADTLESYL